MDGDSILSELEAGPPTHAPTMGALDKVRYSHDALIDLIIRHPEATQGQLAMMLGRYTPAWISNIMASDAFKCRLAARRAELVDPILVASVEERFEGLANRSLEKLMERLDAPNVPDSVLLKAAELGGRGVGVGGFGSAKVVVQPPAPAADRLEKLAHRLINLSKGDTIEGEIIQQAAA